MAIDNRRHSSSALQQYVPGLLVAGTHSGCGKTTLVAGLLRAFRNQGVETAPFKCGPDFLDPQLHNVAAGRNSWNLDTWFMDDTALRDTYMRGSCGADLAIIEGVMGLFDGADHITFAGSSADIAVRLGVPVILVVDASGVGGSVTAIILGHSRLWPNLKLAGVIFNRVSNEGHYRILKEAVETHTDITPLGYAIPSKDWRLPERYLGIHRPSEIPIWVVPWMHLPKNWQEPLTLHPSAPSHLLFLLLLLHQKYMRRPSFPRKRESGH